MKKGKSNFFLIAPFALWGCISVWTSNLVRLTDKSAVPYAWASLFFLIWNRSSALYPSGSILQRL